jgi:putative flippase GtrA
LLVLTGANILATLLRFVLLRLWVFRVRGDDDRVAGLARRPIGEPAL